MTDSIATRDSRAERESRERDAGLTARFVRDAIPYLDQLSGGARRLTRTRADAEDLLQDTMLKAYTGFGSFQEGTNLKAWLFQIMANTWISAYRKTERRPVEQLTYEITDWQLAAYNRHTSTGVRSAETEALEALPDDEIVVALRMLPKGQRVAVYYADVVGLRYAEIATVMGIPRGTVMSRLHRGREQLRTLLAEIAKDRAFNKDSQ